jgi:hypothetical protein
VALHWQHDRQAQAATIAIECSNRPVMGIDYPPRNGQSESMPIDIVRFMVGAVEWFENGVEVGVLSTGYRRCRATARLGPMARFSGVSSA